MRTSSRRVLIRELRAMYEYALQTSSLAASQCTSSYDLSTKHTNIVIVANNESPGLMSRLSRACSHLRRISHFCRRIGERLSPLVLHTLHSQARNCHSTYRLSRSQPHNRHFPLAMASRVSLCN